MKITLYMAMTVNGFIAGENDETPWSDEIWESYYNISKKFKAIILGRRTYELMNENNEFEKIGNPLTIVVSKKKIKNMENFFFVASSKEAISLLREKGIDEAMLGGGGKTNAIFMKEGLINDLIIDIEPLVFGEGIGLFDGADFEKKLVFKSVRKISDKVIQLHYGVVK